jgi:hypothetical protein
MPIDRMPHIQLLKKEYYEAVQKVFENENYNRKHIGGRNLWYTSDNK